MPLCEILEKICLIPAHTKLLTVSPTSMLTPPAGPPTASPVFKEIDPLDASPPFDCPVLNVNDPLEPL